MTEVPIFDRSNDFDLRALSDSQRADLEKTIARRNGSVFFLVHPFYTTPNFQTPDQTLQHASRSLDSSQEIYRYYNQLARLLQSPLQALFLAEEKMRLESTIATMRNFGFMGDIYHYGTIPDWSTPVDGNIQAVTDVLSQSGVRKIVVGGMKLANIAPMGEPMYLPNRSLTFKKEVRPSFEVLDAIGSMDMCVATFAKDMIASNAFDVSVSRLTYPDQHPSFS